MRPENMPASAAGKRLEAKSVVKYMARLAEDVVQLVEAAERQERLERIEAVYPEAAAEARRAGR